MIKSRDLFLLLSLATACQATAAAEGGLSAQLSHCEQVYFGHTNPRLPAQWRVAELERVVLGKSSTGSLIQRLTKVDEALGIATHSGAPHSSAPSNAPAVDAAQGSPPLHRVAHKYAGKAPHESTKNEAAVLSHSVGLTSETAQEDTPPVAPSTVLDTKQLLQLGTQRFKEGDLFRADTAFRQVLVHDPNNVDALFNLGALSEGRGDYVSALGLYRSALQLRPRDTELKQAVIAVEAALSKQTPSDSNPFRSANLDTTNSALVPQTFNASHPLVGTVLTHGDPALLNVSSPQFPLVNNTTPTNPTAPVVSHKTSMLRLLRFAPEPLHCPLCRIIGGF